MRDGKFTKGERVGKWYIEAPLGEGGQASVWRVRYADDKHSPPGALKLCKDPAEKASKRFEQEVALLLAQNHPGIVRVRDVGDFELHPYFVMELASTTLAGVAKGESAGKRLVHESRELLLRFLRQACEAVAHLHSAGVLHRDIKPSNILLGLEPPEPMRAMLADFGVASPEDSQGKLTATHETVGTAAFRAPEAMQGRHSKASDVYSLGKTIEAVLNRGESVLIGPGKCLRDQRLTSDLWDALDEAIERACAFDPARRFENAGELLAALPEAILGMHPSSARAVRAQGLSPISLTTEDRVVLSEIIAECPATGTSSGLYEIRRKSALSEYAFSISARRLADLEFAELSPAQDEQGFQSFVIQPTTKGVNWAQEHRQEMTAAIAETNRSRPPPDDIPF